MEGEAKEAFAAIPGLAAKGRLNPFLLVISDNDTKLSGRITPGRLQHAADFRGHERAGMERHQGAQRQRSCRRFIWRWRAAWPRPGPIRARRFASGSRRSRATACSSTMESASGGHGFPLANGEKIVDFVNEIYFGAAESRPNWPPGRRRCARTGNKRTPPKRPRPPPRRRPRPLSRRTRSRAAWPRAPCAPRRRGCRSIPFPPTWRGRPGMSLFQKSFPGPLCRGGRGGGEHDQHRARGCPRPGFIPIVDTFGQFGVTKGNLPLTMAALSQAPVIAVFSHVGFQDAADGASHEATTYLAATLGHSAHGRRSPAPARTRRRR